MLSGVGNTLLLILNIRVDSTKYFGYEIFWFNINGLMDFEDQIASSLLQTAKFLTISMV